MSATPRRHRAGVTLLELLVVLVLLGITTAVVGLAARAPAASRAPDALAAARRDALRMGQPVTATLHDDSLPRAVTALPDGSVLADTGARIDRLTGRRDRATP